MSAHISQSEWHINKKIMIEEPEASSGDGADSDEYYQTPSKIANEKEENCGEGGKIRSEAVTQEHFVETLKKKGIFGKNADE